MTKNECWLLGRIEEAEGRAKAHALVLDHVIRPLILARLIDGPKIAEAIATTMDTNDMEDVHQDTINGWVAALRTGLRQGSGAAVPDLTDS